MAKTRPIEYIPKEGAIEQVIFPQKYFSGCDVRIKLNGIKIAEISSISYKIQEQHKPLYGYASRMFNEMVKGNRLVIGQFVMPITEYNKLEEALEKIERQLESGIAIDNLLDNANPNININRNDILEEDDYYYTDLGLENTDDYSDLVEVKSKDSLYITKNGIGLYPSPVINSKAIDTLKTDDEVSKLDGPIKGQGGNFYKVYAKNKIGFINVAFAKTENNISGSYPYIAKINPKENGKIFLYKNNTTEDFISIPIKIPSESIITVKGIVAGKYKQHSFYKVEVEINRELKRGYILIRNSNKSPLIPFAE